MSTTEFSIGQVVLPAVDGVLKGLGYEVASLREKALGLVIGQRGPKSLVKFPELALTLWVENSELCDVQQKADSGEVAYQALIPKNFMGLQIVPMVWTLRELIKALKPDEVLSLERGKIRDLIPEAAQGTHGLAPTVLDQECWSLGLAMPQWIFGSEERLSFVLGSKLIWARLLPSGMHKIELLILFNA